MSAEVSGAHNNHERTKALFLLQVKLRMKRTTKLTKKKSPFGISHPLKPHQQSTDNVNCPLCPHRIRKCRPDRDFGSETNAKPIWNSTSVCDSKSDLISALNSRLRLKMESYSILLMRKIAILSLYLSKKVNLGLSTIKQFNSSY